MNNLEIVEVSYSTIKNLGNYENERVEMIAKVNPGQDPLQVLDQLQDLTLKWLRGEYLV